LGAALLIAVWSVRKGADRDPAALSAPALLTKTPFPAFFITWIVTRLGTLFAIESLTTRSNCNVSTSGGEGNVGCTPDNLPVPPVTSAPTPTTCVQA